MRKIGKVEQRKGKNQGRGVLHILCLISIKLPKRNNFLNTISRRISKEIGEFYEISSNCHILGQTQKKDAQTMQKRGHTG